MTAAPPQIFNRRLVRLHRERSANLFHESDFLHRRVMEDIIDRLETVKRDFERALFVGAGDLVSMLTPACGVGRLMQMDVAAGRLPRGATCFIGEEEQLPIKQQSLDLFVSILTLQGANDLIGALAQARTALKPDGLFIAAALGEKTLTSLRAALLRAEAEITGGAAARIAPFAAIQDYGQALSRAGFALPVTDIDSVRVDYRNPMSLMKDLRGMGETRALSSAPSPLRRDVLFRALQYFQENGGQENFDVIYLTGWAPHESQQKPLKPGSAKASLADAVKKLSP